MKLRERMNSSSSSSPPPSSSSSSSSSSFSPSASLGPVRGMRGREQEGIRGVDRASSENLKEISKGLEGDSSSSSSLSSSTPFCVVRAVSTPQNESSRENISPSKGKKKGPVAPPLDDDVEIVCYPSDSPHLKGWVQKEFDIPSKTAAILSGKHGENSSFLSFTLHLSISVMAPPPSAFHVLSHLHPHTLLLAGKSEGIVNGAHDKINRLLVNPTPFFHQVKEWTEQKIHVFVDDSNIFLGARYLDEGGGQQGKKSGERAQDFSVRVKSSSLAQLVEGERNVCRRVVFGSSSQGRSNVIFFFHFYLFICLFHFFSSLFFYFFIIFVHPFIYLFLLFFFQLLTLFSSKSSGITGEMRAIKYPFLPAQNHVENNLLMMLLLLKYNMIYFLFLLILELRVLGMLRGSLRPGGSLYC